MNKVNIKPRLVISTNHCFCNEDQYVFFAKCFDEMRDYDVSIREYGLAIKFESNDSLRLMHTGDRAWVKFLKGDFDGAIEDCQTVLGEDSSQM